jgi:hypothetical protein
MSPFATSAGLAVCVPMYHRNAASIGAPMAPVTRSMVVTLPRPVPCTAVRWCAWNLVNIKHRPGVVGAYKTSAERYRPFSFCDWAKEKCQSCISRCMDNSHQLRDKTVCLDVGKPQGRTVYSLLLEHGAVNVRTAATFRLPSLYPPCSTLNPPCAMLFCTTLNLVIAAYGTFSSRDRTPVVASYLACSHSACDGSNWFSSEGEYPTGSSTMPHSPVSSPNSCPAVATGVAEASSHASAPGVGHTHRTPASFL